MDVGRNSEGKAILEFAIVLPFLVLLTLFGADLYRCYKIHQHLNFVTRELANAAFRSCKDLSPGSDTENCIQSTVSAPLAVSSGPGTLLEGLAAEVRVFAYGTASTPVLKGRIAQGSVQSDIDNTVIASLKSYNADKQELVLVETVYTTSMFSPFFSGIFHETALF